MRTRRLLSSARAAVFAPLNTAARTDLVARRLADAITLGLLDDAEQLPSEPELAARLGVSTVTVREALTMLRQQGLVETRRGRGGGSFVRAPAEPSSAPSQRLRAFGVTLAELRDMGDHYAAIAGSTAALAAERASEEDVARLEEWVEVFARASSPGDHRRAEGHFHLEVAAAAQSPRLVRQELQLQSELGAVLWLPLAERASQRAALADHREIVLAIGAGDEAGARALVRRHVQDSLERVADLHLRAAES